MEYFALLLSVFTFIWSIISFVHLLNRDNSIKKKIYKNEMWSQISSEIKNRRNDLENKICLFELNAKINSEKNILINNIKNCWREIIASHALLTKSAQRASRSIYVETPECWGNLTYQPEIDEDTVMDRCGDLMNNFNSENIDDSDIKLYVNQVTTNLNEMIILLDDSIRIEDINNDPDKI